MKLWSIDVRVYATAYIKAETEEEALKIAKGLKDDCLSAEDGGDVEFSGLALDNPNLPDVSISPVMTIVGPDEGEEASLAYDDVDIADAVYRTVGDPFDIPI